MSGGTLCKVSVGRTGRASNNALYITRQNAVTDRENGILTRHTGEAMVSPGFAELRIEVSSYFWAREEVELARAGKSTSVGRSDNVNSRKEGVKTRQTRTHYRVILSFEHQVETEKAKAMVSEWLDRTPFKDAPAIAAVHRDTDHPHAHVLIDARQINGKKVDLSPKQYRTLDEVWNEIYCREFGLDVDEHLVKKAEQREYKRALLKAKRRGEPLPEPPPRSKYPERDKFAHRQEREDKNIASDETWSAGNRFDRKVRKIERQIKSEFDLRYQFNKQLNPLAQLESRIEAVRHLGEMVYNTGKGLHNAYQRRIAIRESNAQGERGDIAKADAGSGKLTRADANRVRVVEGEARPITTAGRDVASEAATPNCVEHADKVESLGAVYSTGRDDTPAGQGRNKGEFHLAGGESGKSEPGDKRSIQVAQESPASAREERYPASHPAARRPSRTTASDTTQVDDPGDECGNRQGNSLESDGETLGRTRADQPGDSSAAAENISSRVWTLSGDDSDGGDINMANAPAWSNGIPEAAITDRGFDPVWPEPQALPFVGPAGEGVGRGVQTDLDFYKSLSVRDYSLSYDVVEPGAADLSGEPAGRVQSSTRVHPVGTDDSLCAQRSVDEKYLQSRLLDDDLKERFVASNDALLETISQDMLAQTNEIVGQVSEIEAESVEVADSAPIIDIFL